MAGSSNIYANALDQAFSGNINWASDTIKMALVGSGYTPNLATDTHWSDVSANEVTGTGYSAGGDTLGTKTHAVTAANSWGTAWATATPYAVGTVVRPASGNGFLYEAVAISGSGTSGSTPTWPTVVGETVIDNAGSNQIIWSCIGESIIVWGSANPSWSNATISANYAVIYDAQSGTASTEPLICVISFGSAVASTNSTYQVQEQITALGWFWISPA